MAMYKKFEDRDEVALAEPFVYYLSTTEFPYPLQRFVLQVQT